MVMIIDEEGMKLTADEASKLMGRVWDTIMRVVLEQAAVEAVAAGFNEDDVRREIEARAQLLREGRAARLKTARLMLEAGVRTFQ
jgi:hypothetical protein